MSTLVLVTVFGLVGLAVAFVVKRVMTTLAMRRRVTDAMERGDLNDLERTLDELRTRWAPSPVGLAIAETDRAVVLLMREQYEEAIAVCRRALEGPGPPALEGSILNNLAWALAHTGELNQAAEAGERALQLASTRRARSFANGTLGAVYALRGESGRALRHLAQADALEMGGAGTQAARQYYRGVALESKGHTDEAMRAYASARAAAPDTPCGRKAAARVADLQSGS